MFTSIRIRSGGGAGELDLVLGAERLGEQRPQVFVVVRDEDHRPGAVLDHGAEFTPSLDGRPIRV
jgi:hypothetical protein